MRLISLGDCWSNCHGNHVIASDLLSPLRAGDPDSLCELRLDFGGEALVTFTDASGTQLDRFGANTHHRAFRPIPTSPFRVTAEVAARSVFGIPNREPRLIEAAFVNYFPSVRALRRRLDTVEDLAFESFVPEIAVEVFTAAVLSGRSGLNI